MSFLKKIRIPLIILILLILIVLGIIIVRNILVVARNNNAALDFASEMPSNLDDIFADDFLDDNVDIVVVEDTAVQDTKTTTATIPSLQ